MNSNNQGEKPDSLQAKYIWDIIVDLRKELVEAQKTRAKIIEIKITVLTALVGLISALIASGQIFPGSDTGSLVKQVFTFFEIDGASHTFGKYVLTIILFSLPAFTSIFFDFLSDGCSIKIDKIGQYCRQYLEKKISSKIFNSGLLTWEEYLEIKKKENINQITNQPQELLLIVPSIIKQKTIFSNPGYLGAKLLTFLTILIATLSIVWGCVVVLSNEGMSLLLCGFCLIGFMIFMILILIFLINIELYSRYYKMCHNDFEARGAVYEGLYKLLNQIDEQQKNKTIEEELLKTIEEEKITKTIQKMLSQYVKKMYKRGV